MDDAAEQSLSHDLGFNLGVLFRAYVKASNGVVRDIPGGPRGYQVLVAAVCGEAGNQSALAKRLGIDRSVMTYLVDDLEAAGLVVRRPDPDDRRNRQILATDRGRATWERAEQDHRAIDAHILGPLPEADVPAFRDTIERLAERVNALDPLDSACEVVSDLAAAAVPADPARRAPRTR